MLVIAFVAVVMPGTREQSLRRGIFVQLGTPLSFGVLDKTCDKQLVRNTSGDKRVGQNSKILELLKRGGTYRIDLLRYAIMTRTLEPLLIFLVEEYRLRPTASAALAIYDAFFAQHALARIDSATVLPVRDTRMNQYMESLRHQISLFEEQLAAVAADPDDSTRPLPPNAERDVFDAVLAGLWSDKLGPLAALERRYDPELTPGENVPDGAISEGQRSFANDVWRPKVRPLLVNAGFWQLSSID